MSGMFLTVTSNSSLDRILFIEEFSPGKTMRAGNAIDSIGGKGLGVSLVQRALEIDTFSLAFIAGQTGKHLLELIEQAGIPNELIWVEGETRINHILVEAVHRRHSHIITSGYEIGDEECESFLEAYQRHLPEAGWVIVAGSLPGGAPRDLYAEMARVAHDAGKPILIDCFGPPANDAIHAHPTIMKMNRRELNVTFGLPAGSLDEISHSAEALRAKFELDNFIVTCGEDGIILVSKTGKWRAFGPRQKEINGTGAGEAVSAVIPWRLSLNDSWTEALRWAAAAGSATVLTRGSSECRPVDVYRLLPEIHVVSL
jgi:1-phosphofructokinase family hexose kinase